MTISTSGPALRIDWTLAHVIWLELRDRGDRCRESGAFLLADVPDAAAPISPQVVRRAVYYDDLDHACLTGGISLAGSAYDRLWRVCAADELTVVADVHTHPARWVQQSVTDARNPMIALRGHVAVIVPEFASGRCSADGLGVYRYEGNHVWSALAAASAIEITVRPEYPVETLASLGRLVRRRSSHRAQGRRKG